LVKGQRERMIICVKLEVMPTFFQADINTVDQEIYRFRNGAQL
jgi:hypothetical protein